MSINVVVPPLGESVSEATIAKWHKKPGDAVKIDELLVELETDKVTLEVNSPANGKVEEVLVSEGSSVSVGAILGKIAEGAVAATPSVASAPASQPVVTTISQPVNASIITSPAAGKIAQDKGVNLASIQGSGKDNRITKGDVLNASVAPVATAASNVVREERVKMTKLRKTIADRLKYSQNTAAILTTFNEVDMSEVFRIRKQYQEQFMEKHGVKLGFMSIFAKAVVKALKDIPAINAEIDGEEIVYKNYYDLGIAVGTDQGLVVPVVRNVDQMSFSDIEKGIAALGKKARDGKLTMADMSGATFSITNGGTYGSLLSTPIINPPQSGILGMHNIVERPIAVNGQVVIRPMMYIALSYDHRIVDGKEAVTFLVKIKQMVENPEKLLFDL
ncbi:MAG: 2-oxoglutarate dehydrogenase complex dihydrolipoyllysine-residue succinyltransferase [Candidatus Jidaibacter sp.]|jgi:2-oxoglutarate dehydrogenase E2 component (dihydrolipoamide succinyltransferase)|nr:2-oxoglutarate dehydrogenase complex dihydrolipoyllysine-residue succinyltransferase [Candidatus Jidaibacter sp.]